MTYASPDSAARYKALRGAPEMAQRIHLHLLVPARMLEAHRQLALELPAIRQPLEHALVEQLVEQERMRRDLPRQRLAHAAGAREPAECRRILVEEREVGGAPADRLDDAQHAGEHGLRAGAPAARGLPDFREHARQENARLSGNLGLRLTPEIESRFYLFVGDSDSDLPGNLTKAQLAADPTQANPFNLFGDPADLTVNRTRTCYDGTQVQTQCDPNTTDSVVTTLTIDGTWLTSAGGSATAGTTNTLVDASQARATRRRRVLRARARRTPQPG